jgi:iron complex transport system substrate-binding protein
MNLGVRAQQYIVLSMTALLAMTLSLAAAAEAPPRIVSLSPHITELLFAAGAGERIVGADVYSDYPERARAIPRIGDVNALDVERLLALHPSLVVYWNSGTPLRRQQQLKSLGLKLYPTEQRTLADIETALREFGRLAGTAESAERAASGLHADLEQLRRRYAGRQRLRVFYEVWDRPLYTLTRHHVVNEVLSLCGGDNVFADLAGLAPTVDVESVLGRDPEVIIIGAVGKEGDRQARAWRQYPNLKAVRARRIYMVDPAVIDRMTPRIVLGVTEICGSLDQARLRTLPGETSVRK